MKELARQFKDVLSHNIILPIFEIEIEDIILIDFIRKVGMIYVVMICLML